LNIVKFYGIVELNACQTELIYEWMPRSLQSILATEFQGRPLPDVTMTHWGWQLANGLKYLHEVCNMATRALKPENIFLTQQGIVKVGDLATTHQITLNLVLPVEGRHETVRWRAPESFQRTRSLEIRNTQWENLWSVGTVLWNCITGEVPYKECSENQIIQNLMTWTDKSALQVPASWPMHQKSLLAKLWEKDPKARGNANDLQLAFVAWPKFDVNKLFTPLSQIF
jgi:serine/threonine protein kinase